MAITAKGGSSFEKAGTSTVFSFRIDDAIYKLVKEVAGLEKRSINKQLEIFVENGLTEYFESLIDNS